MRAWVAAPLAALSMAACTLHRKAAPARSTSRQQAVKVDPVAQKKAYDAGLQFYGEERYPEAKSAWQESVRLGSGTPLGRKSQEYLKKVDAILKNLREIESQ